jgi:hypothetical protein
MKDTKVKLFLKMIFKKLKRQILKYILYLCAKDSNLHGWQENLCILSSIIVENIKMVFPQQKLRFSARTKWFTLVTIYLFKF